MARLCCNGHKDQLRTNVELLLPKCQPIKPKTSTFGTVSRVFSRLRNRATGIKELLCALHRA